MEEEFEEMPDEKAENKRTLKELEAAIAQQAGSLDPAQRAFVLSEFETYKWNAKKIWQLEKKLVSGGIDPDVQSKYFKMRHQLVAEQSSLFSHIMQWLRGTAAGKSDLDKFLEG